MCMNVCVFVCVCGCGHNDCGQWFGVSGFVCLLNLDSRELQRGCEGSGGAGMRGFWGLGKGGSGGQVG